MTAQEGGRQRNDRARLSLPPSLQTRPRTLPPSGPRVPASAGATTLGPRAPARSPLTGAARPAVTPPLPARPPHSAGGRAGRGPRTRGGGWPPPSRRSLESARGAAALHAQPTARAAPARRRPRLRRPDPRGTQPRLPGPSLPFHPPAVPGLAVSAAHGAGSGGGNVNKSGFYSYLTLECRVHLLSARYQTPAAPSRVFTKADCASYVAETRASDTTLR